MSIWLILLAVEWEAISLLEYFGALALLNTIHLLRAPVSLVVPSADDFIFGIFHSIV